LYPKPDKNSLSFLKLGVYALPAAGPQGSALNHGSFSEFNELGNLKSAKAQQAL
jgi:hypothetical protein